MIDRPDPTGDKRRALKQAAWAAERSRTTESELAGALELASRQGASLRELEAATGIPFNTVKRIIDRQTSTAS